MNWTEKLENKAFYSKRSRMRLMLPFKKLQYLCRYCIQSHQKWKKKRCFSSFDLHNCLCFVSFSRATKPDAFTRICLRGWISPEAWINFQQDRGLYNLSHIWTDWVGRDQCKFCTCVGFTAIVFSLKVFLELHKSKLIHFIMFITDRNFKQNTDK